MINKTLFILFLSFLSCCDSKDSNIDLNNTNWAYILKSDENQYPRNQISWYTLTFLNDSIIRYPDKKKYEFNVRDSILTYNNNRFKILQKNTDSLVLLDLVYSSPEKKEKVFNVDKFAYANLDMFLKKELKFETLYFSVDKSIWDNKVYDIKIEKNGIVYLNKRLNYQETGVFRGELNDSILKRVNYSVQTGLLYNSFHHGEIDVQNCAIFVEFSDGETFTTKGAVSSMYGLHMLVGELYNLEEVIDFQRSSDSITFTYSRNLFDR